MAQTALRTDYTRLSSLPDDSKQLLATALDLIQICRSTASTRAAYCRQLNAIIETGKQDGTRSLINLLYRHHDRLASYLFSPTELRFSMGFDNSYKAEMLKRGEMVSRLLTRSWQKTNTDMEFSRGVFEALKYGCCILKQWPRQEGPEKSVEYEHSLVMPWNFGVYNEALTDLDKQPALCETITMTMPEVWRRIHHLPSADKLYARIKTHAKAGSTGDFNSSFFHQVLSTSTLNTGNTGMSRPVPGGIVQLNNDPSYSIVGPDVAAEMVQMHELWVWDEFDYTTIQVIEPDILIAPMFKRSNLLMGSALQSGLTPYTKIQANETTGYLWGRPEVADLIEPQGLLSTWADDTKRLYGLQIDKILGISSQDSIPDERYDQMRAAGFIQSGPGGSITDLTPAFPPQAIEMLKFLMETMDMVSGFNNILSGQGEAGVRAGQHAGTLLKTSSPALRDRSLLIERQCAEAAHLRYKIMQAKDGRNYWTDPEHEAETSFLLSDMPDDAQVEVDSHSGSPIFADDHQQLIGAGLKMGIVNGDYAIDNLPFPNKDRLHQALKEKQAKEAATFKELMAKDPEAAEKLLAKGKK